MIVTISFLWISAAVTWQLTVIYPRGWMNGLHFPGEQPMNRYLIPWEYSGGQLEPIVTATGESARHQDELPDEAEKPRKRKRVI